LQRLRNADCRVLPVVANCYYSDKIPESFLRIKQPKILAFAGSLREKTYTKRIVKVAAEEMRALFVPLDERFAPPRKSVGNERGEAVR
jgi:hypothetical protein